MSAPAGLSVAATVIYQPQRAVKREEVVRRIVPVVAAVALLLPLSLAGAQENGPRRAYSSLEQLPPLSDWERALSYVVGGDPAVILVSSACRRDSWDGTLFTVVRRIKILAEGGLDYADIEVRIEPGERVVGIAGRTLLADGSVVDLPDEAVEVGADYRGIWGPEFTYSFTLPGAAPGAVVEYCYTVAAPLGRGMRFNSWHLQDWVLTVGTRYTLDIPVEFMPFSAEVENLRTSAEPHREIEGDRCVVTYSFANVPGLGREPYMPPASALFGRLVVDYRWPRSETADPDRYWLQFGRDQARQAELFLAERGGVAELVAELAPRRAEAVELAQAVCAWIQENVVNLSALPPEEVFSGGRLLHDEAYSVAEVLHNHYGTRMEITLLALAMLRQAGLEAHLVLAVDRRRGIMRPGYLDPRQFDQALVAVLPPGGGARFLHPSAPGCPPLGIAWYVQGALALVCSPAGGRFARLPVAAAADNVREHLVELKIESNGDAEAVVATTYHGQESMRIRNLLAPLPASEREELIAATAGGDPTAAEIVAVSFSGLECSGSPPRVEVRMRLPGFARLDGGGIAFEPGLVAPLLEAEPVGGGRTPTPTRNLPAYLPYPLTVRVEERISLPPGFAVADAGPSQYLCEFGRHGVETELIPDGLVRRRRLVLERVFFRADEFAALRRFLDSAAAADGAAVVARRIR